MIPFLVVEDNKSVTFFAHKGSNPIKAQNHICLCREFWPTRNERFQCRTFFCSARKWSKHVGHRMSQGGRINLSSFPFECWNAVLSGVYFPFLLSGNTKVWLRLKNNDLIDTKLFPPTSCNTISYDNNQRRTIRWGFREVRDSLRKLTRRLGRERCSRS